MDQVTLIGLLAGTLTTIAFIPQLQQTWRTRSAQDVSLGMLLTFVTGVFLWLIYGLLLGALPDHSGESHYLGAHPGYSHSQAPVSVIGVGRVSGSMPSNTLCGAIELVTASFELDKVGHALLKFSPFIDTSGQGKRVKNPRGPAAVNGDETRRRHCSSSVNGKARGVG